MSAGRRTGNCLCCGHPATTAELFGADGSGGVRRSFAQPLGYTARVEMEVERDVLELAVLTGVSEPVRLFYAGV